MNHEKNGEMVACMLVGAGRVDQAGFPVRTKRWQGGGDRNGR